MFNRTKKLAVAAIVAGVAFGGLAPVVSADEERGLQRDVNRVWNRDAHRIMNRDVGRVTDHTEELVDDVADDTEETAEYAARTLRQIVNPR